MAQVVGRKAITHDYAVISSIICYHILLHALRLYSNEQSPKMLSLYSTKTLSCPLVYVCRGRNSVMPTLKTCKEKTSITTVEHNIVK
jgi:hypothetical protein